ncbi:MAG: family 16 glycosylhydrolase [Bacteroidales bacterium]|nr:family 16 glycosylhydrolase [Bacteroidales bacterium]MDT8431114.1 family 16 glycosylhydrolase [Bacteroidales bacterium]
MHKIFSLSSLAILLLLFVNVERIKSQSSSNKKALDYHIDEDRNEDFGDLVWSDEFDVAGVIDTSKWFHQTKLPNGTSWWNSEIQHYTDRIENAFNDSGYLHIVARKEEFTDQGQTKQYTSARLNSKFAFTYGKVEIRGILPTGVGTWPAMWTLGKNITENGGYWFTQGYGTAGWPACGEIDIMEHWGTNQDYVSSALHTPSSYGNTSNKGGRIVSNASTEFHVYRLEWTPEKMVFSIDSIVHYTYNPVVKDARTWPFDKDQYMLLNVAVLPDISEDFTQSPMIIDYVRVYEYIGETSTQVREYTDPVIYPNPVEDFLTIEVDQPIHSRVEIYSLSGRLMYSNQLQFTSHQINVSSFDKGLYFITVNSQDFVKTGKIIKL